MQDFYHQQFAGRPRPRWFLFRLPVEVASFPVEEHMGQKYCRRPRRHDVSPQIVADKYVGAYSCPQSYGSFQKSGPSNMDAKQQDPSYKDPHFKQTLILLIQKYPISTRPQLEVRSLVLAASFVGPEPSLALSFPKSTCVQASMQCCTAW